MFFVGHLMWGAALGYLWSRFGASTEGLNIRSA